MENLFASIIIGLIVFILVFLLLREVMCWYYKINERLSVQKETNRLLAKLLNDWPPAAIHDTPVPTPAPIPVPVAATAPAPASAPITFSAPVSATPFPGTNLVFCSECGRQHTDSSKFNCTYCGAVIH
jgi:hypothetical protein